MAGLDFLGSLGDLFGGGGGSSNLDWLSPGSLFGGGSPTLPTDTIPTGSFGAGPLTDPLATVGSAGGGGGGFLDTAAGFAKNLAPWAGLGLTGMGIASGIKGQQQAADQYKLLQKAQNYQQQTAAPAAAAGAALTSAGSQAVLGGALPPQLEAQVTAWGEQARAQLRQYFAQAGISDSTMMQQMESWIVEQQNLMRNQLAQGELQSGLAATQTALGPSSALANTAAGEQQALQTNMAAANAAIAALTGQQKPMGQANA